MKRHPVDFVSLVFGALFVVTALAFIGGQRRVTDVPVAWLWAVPILAAGLAATLAGVRRAIVQDKERQDDEAPDDEAPDDEAAGTEQPTA
jgi:hypothetical protein